MVSRATLAEVPSLDDSNGIGSGPTASQPRDPERRPAQLIVAMELGHKTLDDRQKECRDDKLLGIPADELLPYMEQAARGLDYLHREGIVHRDIKPHNIMLVGDVSKVCDYGLVVTTDADLRSTSNAFTPLYASPEAVGEQPVTGRSDQYSLAITYVELRTGKSPYGSETAASVYAAKETGKYDLSRIRKKRVRNVLRRALARNPNERFGTCSEFIRELDAAENSHPLVFWLLFSAAAVVLLTVGAVAVVPELRERLFPKTLETVEGDPTLPPPTKSEPTISKSENPPRPEKTLPPPAPELREIVADARKLRLAGKFEEAEAKLDEAKVAADSNDSRHWSYNLERLSNEIGPQLSSPGSVSVEQWNAWQQQTKNLIDQSPGRGADGVLLAAMHLFSETRLDPTSVSAERSAGEFARAMSGSNQWGEVLREDEQTSLQALRDGLREKLVVSSQPLSSELKEHLHSIWSDQETLQLLIDRVRFQLRDKNEGGAQAAESDLNELSGELVRNVPNGESQLTAVRNELRQNQQHTALAKLEPYLHDDLSNAAARMNLKILLDSLGEAANAPLPSLLRIESDLEAGGSRKLIEHRNKLRGMLPDLTRGSKPDDLAIVDYARYLRARVEIQLNPTRPLEDIKMLLAWPAVPQTDWHTVSRSAQVALLLLQLANSTLPAARDGELELFSSSSDQVAAAKEYLDKARSLTSNSAAADGLQAIVAAIGAYQANDLARWQVVSETSVRAINNWDLVKDANLALRRPAIEYVGAIAVSRLKDERATAQNTQAIKVFADLLQRHFHEDTASEANDTAIYSRIVVPALELPLNDLDATIRDQLSRIWLAKARLLERDSSFSLVGDPAGGKKDSYSRSMLAANRAFETARQLHETLEGAAGFGRTLLKLSREDFLTHQKQYSNSLASLVERYDPAGNSTNASLRVARAWVGWENAMRESIRAKQLEEVAGALRNYRAVISVTTERDPYTLNNLALCFASNAHVQAAFWTPITASDLINPTDEADLADKDPLGMTKYDHLRRAVSLARAAQLDDSRGLPEEAFKSEGNGLEDLAYYCKFTENYGPASQAFENAAQSAGFSRSKMYSLLSQGRCLFRWSRDAADLNLTRSERIAKLREAYSALKAAIDAASPQENRDAAEAHWWLAQIAEESANSGPGGIAVGASKSALEGETFDKLISIYNLKDSRRATAEAEMTQRIKNYEQAWRLCKQATELAKSSSPHDSITYWQDSLYMGTGLVRRLKQLDPQMRSVNRDDLIPDLLVELRSSATQLLESSQRDSTSVPRSAALRALDVLSQANVGVKNFPENQDGGLMSLKKWEGLFNEPDDRDKLVELLIWEAASGEGEAAVLRAEKAANEIALVSQQDRALGRVMRSRAELHYSSVLKRVVEIRAAKAAGKTFKPIDPNTVKEVVEEYARAEQYLARSKGNDVTASLERVRQKARKNLTAPAEGEFSSNLERYRLQEFLTETSGLRREAVDAATGWFSFMGFEKELSEEKQAEKPTAQVRPMLKLLHDFLKPRAVLREGEGGLLRDERILVDNLEQRLSL